MSMSEEAAAGAERESPSHLSNQGMRKMLRCNYWEIRCQCPNIISFLLIFSKPNARPTTARPDINTISQEVNGSSQLLRKQITSLDLWILDRWHNKQHKHTLQAVITTINLVWASSSLMRCTSALAIASLQARLQYCNKAEKNGDWLQLQIEFIHQSPLCK